MNHALKPFIYKNIFHDYELAPPNSATLFLWPVQIPKNVSSGRPLRQLAEGGERS